RFSGMASETATITLKDSKGEFTREFTREDFHCEEDQDGLIWFEHHCPTTQFFTSIEGESYEWSFSWGHNDTEEIYTQNPTIIFSQPAPDEGDTVTVTVTVNEKEDGTGDSTVETIDIPGEQLHCLPA